jgi:nicotinamide-nucleotide amidase
MGRQSHNKRVPTYVRRIQLSSNSTASRARRVAELLAATGHKIVFAESCTGGLVSGALTQIPGISKQHCGGVVVYRNETKMAYLSIPGAMLRKPGPVSSQVAELMASRVLEKTPEADLAMSVTGHLGPDAPAQQDGHVYVAVAWRRDLPSASPARLLRCRRGDSRVSRQRWVVEQVLNLLTEELQAARKS